MMNKILIFICLALLNSCVEEANLIIENIDIYTGNEFLENRNILISGSEIKSISKDKLDNYKSKNVIDGEGKMLIPPMINAHVHLSSRYHLKYSLEHGIFANLDMHNTDKSANVLREYRDSLYYSEYYSSNAGATVPEGHPTQLGLGTPTITDSISLMNFVKDRVNANADYIKIFKEPWKPTLTSVQTKKLINESHRFNKKAVAHISKIEDAVELSTQNVDGLVHIWNDRVSSEKELEALKSSGLFVVPTLSVFEAGYSKSPSYRDASISIEELLEEVNKVNKKGIPILCGTDAPNHGLNYTDQLFKEMILFKKAGLTNEEILKSATVNIYNAFDLPNYGELKEGGIANFVIIDGNPLENIEDIWNSKMIVKNGKILKAP